MSATERAARVQNDMQAIFSQSPKINRPLGLYEAMARALKYNLDGRLRLMETALEQEKLQLSALDMLPQLPANAGYSIRNNTAASVSKTVTTGTYSLAPSTSSPRSSSTGDLQIAWNILDFGLSYYKARQQANRILMAQERRRKVIHTLLQDVRAAYWRAYAAQEIMPELDDLVAEARESLETMRQVEDERLKSPQEALDYQMTLMQTLKDINQVRHELNRAKTKLASLMNVKPGADFRLRGPDEGRYTLPEVQADLSRLERISLMNRPELREEDYQLKVDRLEARKAVFQLLPGMDFSGGSQYDDNPFLFNNLWSRAAFKVGWNLMNPLSIKEQADVARSREAVDLVRRQALSMAVLTQTHVAWGRYRAARDDYRLSEELSHVAERMAEQARSSAKAGAMPESERIKARTRSVFMDMRRKLAFAELQDSAGNIFVTAGMDPVPDQVRNYNLDTLSTAIASAMDKWSLGHFTKQDEMGPAPPPVPPNRPMVPVNTRIADRSVVEAEPFSFSVPEEVFKEADLRDDVTYSAELRNGKPLPDWLRFHPGDLTFTGTPGAGAVGVLPVRVQAKSGKTGAEGTFVLTVERAYSKRAEMRGLKAGSRVSIIRRCQRDEACRNYNSSSSRRSGSGRVVVGPVNGRGVGQ